MVTIISPLNLKPQIVDGEKAKAATTLNNLATEALLQEIFKVDQVCINFMPHTAETTYFLIKNKNVVCKMTFDDLTPIEDRVTAIRVAMRMQHGNDSKIKGGSPP
jgi:hypothetical protein